MQEDDHHEGQDIEGWARQLAGKANGDVAPDVKALRDAIVASDDSDRNAAAADRLSHARLLERLAAERLLTNPPATKSKYSWQIWAGSIAAALIVAIGVRFVLPPVPVYRGSVADIVITTSVQPEAEQASVARQLQALGLKPRRITEDGRVLLEVEVSEQRLEAFYQWAQQRGGRPVTPGRYRIVIEAGEAAP